MDGRSLTRKVWHHNSYDLAQICSLYDERLARQRKAGGTVLFCEENTKRTHARSFHHPFGQRVFGTQGKGCVTRASG